MFPSARVISRSIIFLGFVLVASSLALAACGHAPAGAEAAKQLVANYLQAGRDGDAVAAYSKVINVRLADGRLVAGPEFLQTILGPEAVAAENQEQLAKKLRANYAAIARVVKTVEKSDDTAAEQYWVTVEEVDKVRVGEVRYLVVSTENGWRIDAARSDISKAMVPQD